MKPQIQYLLNIKLTKIHNSRHLRPSTSQHPSLKQKETRNIRKWKQLPSQNDKEKDLLWWQFFSWRISKEKEKGTFTLKIWEGMKSRRRDEPNLVHRIWLTDLPLPNKLITPLHSVIAYPLYRSPEIMLVSSTLNSMLKHYTILKLYLPMITLLWAY